MRRAIAASLLLCACRPHDPPAPPDGAAATGAALALPATSASARIDALLAAEQKRVAGEIGPADQQSRDVIVRRAAARALARIGGEGARAGLLRALADEDPDVVAWSAYGLGFFCKGHERETVAALVARALGLTRTADGEDRAADARLDPRAAIARAVGSCGAEESEPTLVAWLGGAREPAIAASFALGDLASSKQKLREETLAALLNVAAGSAASPPVPEALYPVGRLEHVPLTVVDRIREVATARLASPGDARLFAVRALARAGDSAAPELARVLTTPGSFTAAERVEAARGLAKLAKVGQRALANALPTLVPSRDPVALSALVGDELGVVMTTLESLTDATLAKKALADLASLAPPPAAPPQILRRVSLLRCGAAKLLAGTDYHDKTLAACDVTAPPPLGGIGARATVDVIGRGPILGPRLTAFLERAHDPDIRAREAAIELLEQHDEIDGAAAILAEALAAKESGVVSSAAEVLAKQPLRAVVAGHRSKRRKDKKKVDLDHGPAEPGAPSPAVVKALLDVLARPSIADDPELAASVLDAAGALALKEAGARLDALCHSPYPTTREHAAKALALVSSEKKTCDAPPEGGPAPAELNHLERAPITLSLDTDAGALTIALDPTLAPVAVTRVADLARAGYYDGLVVHRIVPGFVAQFGAPFGDGAGGPDGKPAIRCETSPLPFAPLTVGVALAGRDTGSSQLFVMHARHPHLDGRYALIGSASGPWTSLAEGDLIRKVKVEP